MKNTTPCYIIVQTLLIVCVRKQTPNQPCTNLETQIEDHTLELSDNRDWQPKTPALKLTWQSKRKSNGEKEETKGEGERKCEKEINVTILHRRICFRPSGSWAIMSQQSPSLSRKLYIFVVVERCKVLHELFPRFDALLSLFVWITYVGNRGVQTFSGYVTIAVTQALSRQVEQTHLVDLGANLHCSQLQKILYIYCRSEYTVDKLNQLSIKVK